MKILHKDNGKDGRFYIAQNDKIFAEMTYAWIGTVGIIITHTEVDDSLAGMEIGEQLVSKAVDFAREKEIRIVPYCTFTKSLLEKEKAFNDVF